MNQIHMEIRKNIRLTASSKFITFRRTTRTFPVYRPTGRRKGLWEREKREQEIYKSATYGNPKDRIRAL